jgi:hypothetical protein
MRWLVLLFSSSLDFSSLDFSSSLDLCLALIRSIGFRTKFLQNFVDKIAFCAEILKIHGSACTWLSVALRRIFYVPVRGAAAGDACMYDLFWFFA